MKKPDLPTQEEINAERCLMMMKFEKDFKAKFMSNGESNYKRALDCGIDPSTFKRMIDEDGNPTADSFIRSVLVHGYTIEVNIVPRKTVSSKIKLKKAS